MRADAHACVCDYASVCVCVCAHALALVRIYKGRTQNTNQKDRISKYKSQDQHV